VKIYRFLALGSQVLTPLLAVLFSVCYLFRGAHLIIRWLAALILRMALRTDAVVFTITANDPLLR
jgi:hypothetical protein